jgi:hypothetical protein
MMSYANAVMQPLKHGYWDVRRRVCLAASKVGERLGLDAMTYNVVVFEYFASAAAQAAPGFAACIRSAFPGVRTVTDVGCGTGHFVHSLRKTGISAVGYEHSKHGRRFAATHLGLETYPFDLNHIGPHAIAEADLAMSVEVAEHLPPHLGDKLVDVLVGIAPIVLFTAATPGQRGTGHVNEQPPEYWHFRFAQRGFAHDTETSLRLKEQCRTTIVGSPWIAKNLMVFRAVRRV